MKQPPIITTRDRKLSLWETLGESLQRFIHKDMSTSEIRQLPFMQAIYAHVEEAQGKKLAGILPDATLLAEKSKTFYALAQAVAIAPPDATLAKSSDLDPRNYSDEDSEWIYLGITWANYMTQQQIKHAEWYQKLPEAFFFTYGGACRSVLNGCFKALMRKYGKLLSIVNGTITDKTSLR